MAEVFKTLRDAVILVAIVVLVFLQDWKALVLPMIDVGVSLVGTFAVMAMMGFSLNNLTLFGLVLAIGIVVDDAIVVLENIERWIGMGYKVRDATIHAMDEITGPIIAITLVLSSVFLPSAFPGGHHGAILSPVRADDRGLDGDLGHQRHDDDPGPGHLGVSRSGAGRTTARSPRSIAVVGHRDSGRPLNAVDRRDIFWPVLSAEYRGDMKPAPRRPCRSATGAAGDPAGARA